MNTSVFELFLEQLVSDTVSDEIKSAIYSCCRKLEFGLSFVEL
jgi:hypothetical protein